MAATLTQDRFTGEEWLFEQKFDGIRLLAYKNGADVKLFSRNCLPKNIPAVADSVKSLPATQLILDGEITWGRRLAQVSRVRLHVARRTQSNFVAARSAT
ncbi:MAG: hypothetical protein ACR2LM_20380 [Pyrinomonadaceae bacterium]